MPLGLLIIVDRPGSCVDKCSKTGGCASVRNKRNVFVENRSLVASDEVACSGNGNAVMPGLTRMGLEGVLSSVPFWVGTVRESRPQ